MLSGFWVNESFFITCAHAFEDIKKDAEKEEIIAALKALKTDATDNFILISSDPKSSDIGMYEELDFKHCTDEAFSRSSPKSKSSSGGP